MCGAFSLFTDRVLLSQRFDVPPPRDIFLPRYNARPSQMLPAILNIDPGQIVFTKWGIVPPWAKTPSQQVINARAESLTEKPLFRKSFEERRCLVLTDGFYEWAKLKDGSKAPFRFELKSKEPFAFAGIWQEDLKTGEPEFAIITTEPNKLVEKVHNRMPAILRREDEKSWLNPDLGDNQLKEMLKPYSEKLMESYMISTMVNSPRNDSKEIIKPMKD